MRLMILWLALAAAGAWLGSRRLDADVDVLAMLPQSVPEVRGMRLLREHFQERNDLLVVIESAEAGQAREAASRLLGDAKLAALAKSIRLLDGGVDMEQGGSLLAWAWQNAPADQVEALVHKLTGPGLRSHLDLVTEKLGTTPDAAEVQRWSHDPLGLLDVLGGKDMDGLTMAEEAAASETVQIVQVQPKADISSYKEAMPWVSSVRDRAAEISAHMKRTGIDTAISLTGEAAFMAETGGGMEKDLSMTIGGSLALIAALFWLMYRRLMPLVFIVLMLASVLGITLGIGSLVLGGINAMSLGFAAIVLGLVVDYGALIYQESGQARSAGEIRSRLCRSILGGAATTAAVFLLLSLSSIPGLRQLGLLVAIGVAVGAAVMLAGFPQIAIRFPFARKSVPTEARPVSNRSAWAATAAMLLLAAAVVAWKGLPGFDGSSAPLRPRQSEAMRAMEKIERMGTAEDKQRVPLIVTARTLPELKSIIARQQHGWLPGVLLPDEAAQLENRSSLQALADAEPRILGELDAAGFTSDSAALFSSVMRKLREALRQDWPQEPSASPASESLKRFISRSRDEWAVLGWAEQDSKVAVERLEGTHMPSWPSLGQAMSRIAVNDALLRMLPLAAVILAVLFAVFRTWREVALTVAALLAGFSAWFAVMSLAGQSWNVMSIAAIPLLIGTAEDYSVHMLMAMQRTGGDIALARSTTGRAVLFCGLSSMIGFGSLACASNGGLASLGIACSLGIAMTMLVALWLLPQWFARLTAKPR